MDDYIDRDWERFCKVQEANETDQQRKDIRDKILKLEFQIEEAEDERDFSRAGYLRYEVNTLCEELANLTHRED